MKGEKNTQIKIYELNMDYYKKIWYDKNEKEIEKITDLSILCINKLRN